MCVCCLGCVKCRHEWDRDAAHHLTTLFVACKVLLCGSPLILETSSEMPFHTGSSQCIIALIGSIFSREAV